MSFQPGDTILVAHHGLWRPATLIEAVHHPDYPPERDVIGVQVFMVDDPDKKPLYALGQHAFKLPSVVDLLGALDP